MNITIKGLSEIYNQFRLNSQECMQLAQKVNVAVSNAIYNNWLNLASKELKSTKERYMRGLIEPDFSVNGMTVKGMIVLFGKLALMVEDGSPPFDMKIGFSQSSKIKLKAIGGWYLIVPFRHSTPGAIGENEAFANVMPKEVYAVAKDLNPTKSDFKGVKVLYGSSLKEGQIPKPYDEKKTRPGYGNFKSYTHKSSIYEGMIRNEKTYAKTTKSSYFTFRRVSDTSDPNSWIHPGFKPVNLAEKSVNITNIDIIVENEVADFLDSIGI